MALLLFGSALAGSSDTVLEGLTKCTREDRGRPVCQIEATGAYTFVSEAFLRRYQEAVQKQKAHPVEPSQSVQSKTLGDYFRLGITQGPESPPKGKETSTRTAIQSAPTKTPEPKSSSVAQGGQCPEGVPQPLGKDTFVKVAKRTIQVCGSVSELQARYEQLRKDAANVISIVAAQSSRMKQLRVEMTKIGDACPDDFRCSSIAGIIALHDLDADHLADEAFDIGQCAIELENRLNSMSPLPPNASTLYNQIDDIQSGTLELDRKMGAQASIAKLRMRGFDGMLNQCRGSMLGGSK